MGSSLRLGIVTAMPQECALLANRFAGALSESIASRQFLLGRLGQIEAVLVVSHIGKVSASATATILLQRYGCNAVVFTGVAGGVGRSVAVGDVVIAENLIQHDLDLKGVLGFDRFVVPSLGVSRIPSCSQLLPVAQAAANSVVQCPEYRRVVGELAQREPVLHVGLIGSGDRFVSDRSDKAALVESIPDLLAVEMEGAAVAQVCAEHGVPIVVARIISDVASDDATVDFALFAERAAAFGSDRFVTEFVARL